MQYHKPQIFQVFSLNGWEKQHRVAASNSKLITAQEQATMAIVLFHHSESLTLAEVRTMIIYITTFAEYTLILTLFLLVCNV